MYHKCTECGNTFRTDPPNHDAMVTCPICEANYKTIVKDGKTRLTDYIYETEDLGEL